MGRNLPTEHNGMCSVLLMNEKAGNIFHWCFKVTTAYFSREKRSSGLIDSKTTVATQLVGIWLLRDKEITQLPMRSEQ